MKELKIQVEEFNIDYSHVLDHGDIQQWPSFFTDDAVYRITSRENFDLALPGSIVYCCGLGMIRDRARAMAETQYYAPRYLLHFNSNVRINSHWDDIVEAQSNFLLTETLVDKPTKLHLSGTYYDVFKKTDRLLLQHRTVVYDSNLINSAVILPV